MEKLDKEEKGMETKLRERWWEYHTIILSIPYSRKLPSDYVNYMKCQMRYHAWHLGQKVRGNLAGYVFFLLISNDFIDKQSKQF